MNTPTKNRPLRFKPQYRAIEDTNLSNEAYNRVICPNLRIGIRMGLLNPNSEGWVTDSEMCDFFEYIGVVANAGVSRMLLAAGRYAPKDKKPKHINVTKFRGTVLDHGSSSGIVNNDAGFCSKRLDVLKQFACQQSRLTKRDLAIAANNFHRCPVKSKSLVGTHIGSLEYAAMLEIYGRKDEQGRKYFTADDIDCLWRESRFPKGWKAPDKSYCGTWLVLLGYFSFLFNRIRVGWWKTRKKSSKMLQKNA